MFNCCSYFKLFKVRVPSYHIIRDAYVYRSPLFSWQSRYKWWYHAFVVFETDKWWWSIEKNAAEVIIKRSKNKPSVVDKGRNGIVTLAVKARGSGSVSDLISYISKARSVSESYDFWSSNCKHFAHNVFRQISKGNKSFNFLE